MGPTKFDEYMCEDGVADAAAVDMMLPMLFVHAAWRDAARDGRMAMEESTFVGYLANVVRRWQRGEDIVL